MNQTPLGYAILVLGLISSFGASAPSTSSDVVIPGSYEIRVCSGPCAFGDSRNVLADGKLVLSAGPVNPEAIPEQERGRCRSGDPVGRPANGCFIITRIPEARTFAGLITFGWTHWSGSENRIQFGLYASSDARYIASVVVDADGFKGTGSSSFVDFTDPLWPADTMIARRVGPADVNRCIWTMKLTPIQPGGAVEQPAAPDGGRHVRG
jgi:hypothetical protein